MITFGYDSCVSKFFRGATNKNTFYDHAGDLLGALVRKRTQAVSTMTPQNNPPLDILKQQDRPFVFVSHSLGGALIELRPLSVNFKTSRANIRSFIMKGLSLSK